jgi:uncharacterized protein YyaL (SSP411 family)
LQHPGRKGGEKDGLSKIWLVTVIAAGAAVVTGVRVIWQVPMANSPAQVLESSATARTGGEGGDVKEGRNRLRFSKSPYLLQHAGNPVDWYPWGEEAFERARREDKPVFLSIGYSTCHWCHVMEHESFENEEIAELMNDAFVSVKVDREERPDIDDVYMTVCQMVTGRGGWPLTIIMTPDRKPFFAATYIPRESRFGMTGMRDLIPRVKEAWKTKREQLLESAGRVEYLLRQTAEPDKGGDLGTEALDRVYGDLEARFDGKNGGFGGAPKFPTPTNLLFLLRYWKRTGREKALQMVVKTLRSMRRGGVYDHLGFGFHRYSTDAVWLVPHFEKMLYDQALLAMAYTEAYQATGRDSYRTVAEEVFAYVARIMTSPEGGFYSAEDADSESEEGRFYVWDRQELIEVLGEEEGELIAGVFNVTGEGNFRDEATGELTGRSILYTGTDPNVPRKRLEKARGRLLAVRGTRVRPHLDDKILTDWNGLMIAALAKAARAFDEKKYADAAVKAADFIMAKLKDENGRLLHRYREGDAAIPAYLDDYSFLAWGLVELYQATFDTRFLKEALRLSEEALAHFWDGEAGGFHFTADDAEKLLVRSKRIHDGAVPSGNSVAMLNLLKLARITGDAGLEEKAAGIIRAFSSRVDAYPSAFAFLMSALDFGIGPSAEVVIAGVRESEDTGEMLRALRSRFLPNTVVLFRPSGREPADIAEVAPFTKSRTSVNGKATAYVCVGQSCSEPTTDAGKMIERLEGR